jgi:hypothetical protein
MAPCDPVFVVVLINKSLPQHIILTRIRDLLQEVRIKATVINSGVENCGMNLKEKAFKFQS